MATIFGMKLITDCESLEVLLSAMGQGLGSADDVEKKFPNFLAAAKAALRDLTLRGLPHSNEDSMLVYMNHRVQAWCGQAIDQPPSPLTRIDPDLFYVRKEPRPITWISLAPPVEDLKPSTGGVP